MPSPHDDDARAIPQRRPKGTRPVDAPDDDVYVVDTRGRRPGARRQPPSARRAQPAPQRPAPEQRRESTPAVEAPRRPPAPQTGPSTARVGGTPPPRTLTRAMPVRPGERPPRAGGPVPPRRDSGRPGPRSPRRPHRGRLIAASVAVVLVAWAVFMVWVPVHAWNTVSRVDATPAGARPATSRGHNFLLVGSDSRAGLTAAQKKEYRTGGDVGQRTDSIILIHVPSGGGLASMISLPRDSYVPIPGHGSNKINAAYAFGGPKLLVQTVEGVTDLRIDGFMEIGFAGFAGVVDSLGGVTICVPFAMNDKDAGINLAKGCQLLDGKNALGYVRARHSDPRGDIGRAERQRQFLAAIMKKAATPSTVLVPTRYYRFSMAAASGLRVSKEMSLSDAVSVLKVLRSAGKGDALSFTVPISSLNYQTSAGSSVKWNTELARRLFTDLRNDTPLTADPQGTDGKPHPNG